MRSPVTGIAAILILLICSAATYQRNAVWHDPETLGRDNIRKSPGKGRVYYNLGTYFVKQGRLDDAIEQFQAAIRVRPTSEEYNNLGLAYESKGMVDSAVEMFQFAVYLDPANAEAYNNLGKAYLLYRNRTDDAIALFNKAIALRPGYIDAALNLAAAHIRGRRFRDAVPLLETILAKEPGRDDARYNLGVAHYCLREVGAGQREWDILRERRSPLADRLEAFMSRPCDKERQR